MPAVRRLDISKKDAKVCVRVAGAGRRKTVETVTTRGSMMSQILALALPTLAPAPPTLSASTDGQPFTARPGTPNADAEPRLLAHTPTRPSRRVWAGPTSKVVCDQYHDYRAEQLAFHGGAMDRLVEYTETTSFTPPILTAPGMVMDFYDGNTVIALWNYAQALRDERQLLQHYLRAIGAERAETDLRSNPRSQQGIHARRQAVPAHEVIDAGEEQGRVIGDAQPPRRRLLRHTDIVPAGPAVPPIRGQPQIRSRAAVRSSGCGCRRLVGW
jgi:hypothetical protein